MKIRSFITKSRAGHYTVTVYREGEYYPFHIQNYVDNIVRARELLARIRAAAESGAARYEGGLYGTSR